MHLLGNSIRLRGVLPTYVTPTNDVCEPGYRRTMALKRLQVGLSSAQLKLLEKLAVKLGLDKTNTLRYCLNRVAEQEGLTRHAER